MDDLATDEAGCQLRRVVYNGESLCLPGNVASMMAIVNQITSGDCYPVYPLNCQHSLDDSAVYYQFFYVPAHHIETALIALTEGGHKCFHNEGENSSVQGSIRCAI